MAVPAVMPIAVLAATAWMMSAARSDQASSGTFATMAVWEKLSKPETTTQSLLDERSRSTDQLMNYRSWEWTAWTHWCDRFAASMLGGKAKPQ